MSTEKEELKPCPFCGPRASSVSVYDAEVTYGGGKPFFKVGCGRCGSSSGLCKSEADATDLWNNRIPMPQTKSTMSTEKDLRAAEDIALGVDKDREPKMRAFLLNDIYTKNCVELVLKGIQYARQGERGRLRRFAQYLNNFKSESKLEAFIDECLEQEKS